MYIHGPRTRYGERDPVPRNRTGPAQHSRETEPYWGAWLLATKGGQMARTRNPKATPPRKRKPEAVPTVPCGSLRPGDLINGRLPGDKRKLPRLVTDVRVRSGITTFRATEFVKAPDQGGEIFEIPTGYPVASVTRGNGEVSRPRRSGHTLFDRARLDARTEHVLKTWAASQRRAA